MSMNILYQKMHYKSVLTNNYSMIHCNNGYNTLLNSLRLSIYLSNKFNIYIF